MRSHRFLRRTAETVAAIGVAGSVVAVTAFRALERLELDLWDGELDELEDDADTSWVEQAPTPAASASAPAA